MARLIIFGAGDIARLAHFYFTRDSEHDIVAFTVDSQYCKGETFLDLPLVPFEKVAMLYPVSEYKMFVALSYARMNKLRAAKYHQGKEKGYELVSYISSRCSFLTDYPVGDNCFILEDTIVQPFARIGNNVTLWSGSHVGHDTVIEDHCFLAPHSVVSGWVRIRNNCFIGVNATLRNSITIAPETLVGAGAVITNDTAERGVYLPGRAQLSSRESSEFEL